MLLPLPARATGEYWVSPTYLDGPGQALKSAPEFFWHLEVQRLAEKYRDKASAGMKVRGAASGDKFLLNDQIAEGPAVPNATEATAAADLADFEDALKTSRLKPADAAAATNAHAIARAAIHAQAATQGPQPLAGDEADSEFADYHAGAAAQGKPEGVAAWQKLLARPKEERHYRSVWAAFMLGKNALAAKQWADAVKYFEQCRALAREGFADSLALAADSYGWQGRAELMAEHYPRAARLYLTQLALGDHSAIVSLKRMIPEWMSSMSGGLPGEPVDENAPPPAPPEPNKARNDARWLEAARDPALQELVTAHILATDTAQWTEDTSRSRQWLEVIGKAGLEKLEDATRLAWMAYTAGDYKTAKAWLGKASGDSPLGRWLEAKFALREGKLDAAAKILPSVTSAMPPGERVYLNVTPAERACGEAAALLFSEGRYVEAFHTFLKASGDEDMRYMIESILTPEELLAIAAKLPAPKTRDDADQKNHTEMDLDRGERVRNIRSQIGRRLVREGKVNEGRPLLGEESRQSMGDYIALAVKAEDKKVSAEDRARAWREAAVLMLEHGHYFRGTEQDFHLPENDSGDWTVRPQRSAGVWDAPGTPDEKPGKRPVFIPVTAAEKKRLAATAKHHAKPMRTRMIAVSHLLKAADLLTNGSEEKARVLNVAGFWLQDIDNPAADKIYNRIEKDYANTPTGQAILAKRWFTGDESP